MGSEVLGKSLLEQSVEGRNKSLVKIRVKGLGAVCVVGSRGCVQLGRINLMCVGEEKLGCVGSVKKRRRGEEWRVVALDELWSKLPGSTI